MHRNNVNANIANRTVFPQYLLPGGDCGIFFKISTWEGGAKQSGIAKTASKRSGWSGNALRALYGVWVFKKIQKNSKKIQKKFNKNTKIAARCRICWFATGMMHNYLIRCIYMHMIYIDFMHMHHDQLDRYRYHIILLIIQAIYIRAKGGRGIEW